MTSYVPCSDLETRAPKWVATSDNAKNSDGRPAPYVAWGVSAVSVAAQYAEAHAGEYRCPISGWRSAQWG